MHLQILDRQSRFSWSADGPILFASASIKAQLTFKGRHESEQGASQDPDPSAEPGAPLTGFLILTRSN